ncbi:MAG: SPOR domain-containing protein [Aestuariivita sp.]|nr:SPOR domain-containing protein [Aestuariivita sp.]
MLTGSDNSVDPQTRDIEISSEIGTRWIAIFSNGFNIFVLLSFLLLVALWVYHLHTRDLSEVPIVSSPEGSMRILPENPGGKLADNQEFAVNNIVEKGSSNEQFDDPILAPESISLLEEDQPVNQVIENGIEIEGTEIPENIVASENNQNLSHNINVLPANGNGLNDSPNINSHSVEQMDRELGQNNEEIRLPAVILSDVEPFVSASLIPQMRPSKRTQKSISSEIPKQVLSNISTISVPSGAQVVQLGAFPSSDIAKKSWKQLGLRLGDYLAGKRPIVQLAVAGGRTFFRLRAAGFSNLDDARQFCSRLVADGLECIPVVAR